MFCSIALPWYMWMLKSNIPRLFRPYKSYFLVFTGLFMILLLNPLYLMVILLYLSLWESVKTLGEVVLDSKSTLCSVKMKSLPPIRFTTLSKKKKKKRDMWHATHDMWHVTPVTPVTCDMWHVTRDTWHVTCWGSQNFSSLALTVCDLWCYED